MTKLTQNIEVDALCWKVKALQRDFLVIFKSICAQILDMDIKYFTIADNGKTKKDLRIGRFYKCSFYEILQ